MKKNDHFNVYVWTKEYNNKASNQPKYNSPYISLEEYNQIKLGMSYSQVVSIIGGKGDAVTEYGDTKIYIYGKQNLGVEWKMLQ